MCGHDDPDEADQAGDRDRRGGPECRGDDEREPHPAHVDAEARCLVVAEVQHVDDAAEREDDDAATATYGRTRRTSDQPVLGMFPRIHE